MGHGIDAKVCTREMFFQEARSGGGVSCKSLMVHTRDAGRAETVLEGGGADARVVDGNVGVNTTHGTATNKEIHRSVPRRYRGL